METKLENGEVVFWDDNGILVTNKYICTPKDTIRLSDIKRVELFDEKENLTGKIAKYTAWFLFIGCQIYNCVHNWPADVTLENFVFYSIPALIASWFYWIGQKFETKLIAHCPSGTCGITSTWIACRPYCGLWGFFNGKKDHESEQHQAEIKKIESLEKAIGKALAHSATS